MPPGTRNALVPPSPNYLRNAGEFTGGLLRGSSTALMGSLQMRDQLALDAYRSQQAGSLQGVYADAWRAAQEAAANPSMITDAVGNSLRGMWNRAKSGPAGLGEVVGENIDPRNWLKPRKALRKELDVYHGTPHTFDPETGAPLGRFRSEKIGTGEGAQAYGYGLYFAESPDVAKEYQLKLSGVGRVQPMIDQYGSVDAAIAETEKRIAHFRNAVAEKRSNPATNAGMLQIAEKSLEGSEKALQDLRSIKAGNLGNQGSRYKVDLPDAKIEQMLDWDKPISQQPAMQKAFTKFWKGLSKNERAQAVFDEFGDYDLAEQMAKSPGEVRGRLAYTLMTHHLGDQAAASDFLRQQGVPGIKYLDAGSRKGEKGTRNFVVFPGEEQSLNILSRD